MNDFRARMIGQTIDGTKDLATSLADKFIKDDEIKGFTNQIVRDTSQSLHDLHKSRLSE